MRVLSTFGAPGCKMNITNRSLATCHPEKSLFLDSLLHRIDHIIGNRTICASRMVRASTFADRQSNHRRNGIGPATKQLVHDLDQIPGSSTRGLLIATPRKTLASLAVKPGFVA